MYHTLLFPTLQHILNAIAAPSPECAKYCEPTSPAVSSLVRVSDEGRPDRLVEIAVRLYYC